MHFILIKIRYILIIFLKYYFIWKRQKSTKETDSTSYQIHRDGDTVATQVQLGT